MPIEVDVEYQCNDTPSCSIYANFQDLPHPLDGLYS